ncbi:bifunctional adenosylcobinamide kinase/adenosylcobinamide-phosphate guanylyltransferase [Leptolyngbya iicbica]|uniref:Adenosylcobinamide kinase n=2 Tax=Cyanophyceae TaxID=3028117 RepID=A0A4Q7E2D3_9CYAN|nr:bifunctional adenosylcobinamide kinase/adenosylcobinamide-phosphate guanylyltransferase [Leptolyngbya sp. LK]RZM76580.1 bifunctional adenosylcobinamide kinase/adenosylcobinamide-phosphate guanylyltransferase [Leptolyngbya sp. LK]
MGTRILVTGPTKSGKSEWAEQLAAQQSQAVVYVATSRLHPDDAEWQARVAAHRQRRAPTWQTLEVPTALPTVLKQATTAECWLVDALGTWVANRLEQSEEHWNAEVEALLAAIAPFPGTLILVAEETGWGVVPAYPLGCTFRDRLGSLTRQVAAIVDVTYLVVAGFAIDLRQMGTLIAAPQPDSASGEA